LFLCYCYVIEKSGGLLVFDFIILFSILAFVLLKECHELSLAGNRTQPTSFGGACSANENHVIDPILVTTTLKKWWFFRAIYFTQIKCRAAYYAQTRRL